jgi:hypothetical protein
MSLEKRLDCICRLRAANSRGDAKGSLRALAGFAFPTLAEGFFDRMCPGGGRALPGLFSGKFAAGEQEMSGNFRRAMV